MFTDRFDHSVNAGLAIDVEREWAEMAEVEAYMTVERVEREIAKGRSVKGEVIA